jgi:hypothetical protein
MGYIQVGFIQNHYDSQGRTTHYRCTLPIPAAIVPLINMNSVMTIGKRNWFIYASPNWDDVQDQVAAMQYTVNDYKEQLYKSKKEIALSKLTKIK